MAENNHSEHDGHGGTPGGGAGGGSQGGTTTLNSANLAIALQAFAGADSVYFADLNELNNSDAEGGALLALDGDQLTVITAAKGVEAGQIHPQHIHGFEDGRDADVPTLAQDDDRDGFIELAEGLDTYGPILLNLTSPPGAGAPGFPAPEGDSFLFFETYDLSDPANGELATLLDEAPLDTREIVLHGASVLEGHGEGTEGEIDGTAGYKLVLPIASGEIEELSFADALSFFAAALDAIDLIPGDGNGGGDGDGDSVTFADAAARVTVDLTGEIASTGAAAGVDFEGVASLTGSAFNDTFRGDAEANVFVGGAGDDRLHGRAGDDSLEGGLGDDVLNAGGQADTLLGGEGDDVLIGGFGADVHTGGAGADTFVFNGMMELGDRITDFVSGEDRITFDAAALGIGRVPAGGSSGDAAAASLVVEEEVIVEEYLYDFVTGTTAVEEYATFLYDDELDELYYDVDGIGVEESVVVTTFEEDTTFVESDFLLF